MEIVEVDLNGDLVADAAEVAAYLDACPKLVVAAGLDPDPLTDDAPLAVPVGTASDGTHAWPLSVAYFTRVHGIAPDQRLLDHIRSRNYTPPEITADGVERLRVELAAASTQTAGQPATEIHDAHGGASGSWGEMPPT